MIENQPPVWCVAIFAAREKIQDVERTLVATLAAITVPTRIDILVNGNRDLASETARLVEISAPSRNNPCARVHVWFIPLGDKAHAWNQYVHFIWPDSGLAFFIDGYVRVKQDALGLLDGALADSHEHLAGTGVPSVGLTAKSLREEMLKNGGIHGNLFALKASTMKTLKGIGFRLPLGIYRTDPTLGAALAFSLDPAHNSWNPKGRILVHPGVTWETDVKKPWNFSDVRGQFKRMLRQGQGILENHAVRQLFAVQKQMPQSLPATAADLVLQWVDAHPRESRKAFWRHPLLIGLALKKLRYPKDWSQAAIPSEQIYP